MLGSNLVATQRSLQIDEFSPWLGQRLDRVVQSLCGKSRKEVFGLFDHHCVLVNGAICSHPGRLSAAGDRVVLKYDAQQRYHPLPALARSPGFEIVFEDRWLLVVNKPAALLTVPTARGEKHTLLDKVSQYVRHSAQQKSRQAYTCHRLDRGVSGLLVLAKSAEISQQLRDQFALSKPEREYAALVAGHMPTEQGTFKSLLATDKNLTRFSTADEEIGQLAITHYRVVKHAGDATLVQVWLETGRRNQIRVHFAEAGHPVLGDPRYRPAEAAHRNWPYKRLALHARLLGFVHPATGQELRFESPLPAEMERFLASTAPPGKRPAQDPMEARRRRTKRNR
jgi:23S rRNA pseudouridine1911/1915/1917 synthase